MFALVELGPIHLGYAVCKTTYALCQRVGKTGTRFSYKEDLKDIMFKCFSNIVAEKKSSGYFGQGGIELLILSDF